MRSLPLTRLLPALLAGTIAVGACTDATETGGGLDPGNGNGNNGTILDSDGVVLTSALTTVDSCDALLERIKDEAIERVGPFGFDQEHYFFEGDIALDDGEDAMEESAVDAAAPAQGESGALADGGQATAATTPALGETDSTDDSAGLDRAGGNDGDAEFSGTNNQERDVDEADLVKTDGERLVIASGNELRIIDVTASTPRLVDTVRLPDEAWGGQLFLDGDRALLMTSGWTERPFLESSIDTDWYPGSPIGRLLEIDLVEGRIGRTFEFEGGYLSARSIDGTMRIVLTATANRFAFVYPSNEGAVESAERANRDLIEGSTIEQWIPTYRITDAGQTVEEGPIVDCDRVHLPSEFAGFGSMVVLTAGLDGGLQVNDALSVFTDAQMMYASTDRVAVATPRWPEFGPEGEVLDQGETFSTAIHTFDITDPTRADYVASGSVRGHLLNQFSMSEYDGYLRVATTDGAPWWGGRGESESFVTVFSEEDAALTQVGQVGGLGLGEQIFAVRFLGDIGYVVTFEQIDPLYTVDLSDPTNPEVLGELKIPGFSSYLHPIGPGRLLGVGTDGDDTGRTFGTAVSLFDVSDLSNPELISKLTFDVPGLGSGGEEGETYSPVSHDAKAFTWWDDTAFIPFSWWAWDPQNQTEQNGSAVGLVVADNDELVEIGRVVHPGITECESGVYFEEELDVPAEEEPPADDASGDAEANFVDPEPGQEPTTTVTEPARPAEEFCWTWTPEIRRSVIIDDDLYTISDGGVAVHTLDELNPVVWIPFELRG